ncbi:MAG: tripartite tricarboxylate transporter substrate binding protein [Burkholderiaceae bacterium]|nr:tripartite tricarboxylate transporter substrate binding protein [Burkholderiaceae bacterium]
MRLHRFISVVILAVMGWLSLGAHAAFPDKPVRIVIGFPAGGPLDQHIRLLSTRLAASLGQPVVIDYKAGAGGTIGAQFVAQSAPDGYTLLLANTGTMVINPAIYTQKPYETLRDFAPVARTAQQALALIVNDKVPARTLKELIQYAKANPGKLNYGSAGNGGISHLVPEMLKVETGISMVHVPYKGTAPAFTDLMAGHVDFMADSIPQAVNHLKDGKIRVLAVTSNRRNPALTAVPTVLETGVATLDVVGFYGILAPKGTPADIVRRLSQAFKDSLEAPEIQKTMADQGSDPAWLGPEQFAAFLNREMPRWAQAVKAAGAKLD